MFTGSRNSSKTSDLILAARTVFGVDWESGTWSRTIEVIKNEHEQRGDKNVFIILLFRVTS